MFDPLSESATPFADASSPWEAPKISRPEPPAHRPELSNHSDNVYGKQPQVYGQPDLGLVSPPTTQKLKADPYIRVKITGLDRNKRDILVRFDAQTNLSNFTGHAYRNVSRSYAECQQFHEALMHANPQTIIPCLPLAQTSAPTDEEDDRLVRIMLQRWLTRICLDPVLMADEDLRAFIESDFGYQPTQRPRRRASSGFSLFGKNVPDEDEHLQRSRFELTKLETQYFDAAKAIDKLAAARRSIAQAQTEMGNRLINVAITEAHLPLGNAIRKLGRTWHSLADLSQAQAISECVVIGDTFGYQGMNSRAAKEILQARTGFLEEYQAAVKAAIGKRRAIERLKASSNIRPERVDEALEELEEANQYEAALAKRADGISQNLHRALSAHDRFSEDDVSTALVEHARSTIMYERQLLRELEALRVDVAGAARKVAPSRDGPPKPTIVPPLEELEKPMSRAEHVPPHTAVPQRAQPNGHYLNGKSAVPPKIPAVRSAGPVPSIHSQLPPPSIGRQPVSQIPSEQTDPLGQAKGVINGHIGASTSSNVSGHMVDPDSPNRISPIPASVSSPSRFDGSKSMFVPARPVDEAFDPLSATASPSSTFAPPVKAARQELDPLGSVQAQYMSKSMRVTPTRPRLDAREAARKLAGGF